MPDYGIVFPFGYSKIFDEDIKYVQKTLSELLKTKGFDLKTIKTYEEKLLSTENNTVHKIGKAISPRLKFIETYADFLNWILSFLFGFLFIIFYLKIKQRKNKT